MSTASWLALLLALAALGGGSALWRWWRVRSRPRLRRRRFVPSRPRYPVVLVHGRFGFDEVVGGKVRHAYYKGVREAQERDGHAVQVARLPAAGSIAARAAGLAALVSATEPPASTGTCCASCGPRGTRLTPPSARRGPASAGAPPGRVLSPDRRAASRPERTPTQRLHAPCVWLRRW